MMIILQLCDYVWMGNGNMLELTIIFLLMKRNSLLHSVNQLMEGYGLWCLRRHGPNFMAAISIFKEAIIDQRSKT